MRVEIIATQPGALHPGYCMLTQTSERGAAIREIGLGWTKPPTNPASVVEAVAEAKGARVSFRAQGSAAPPVACM